jgi:hypothetical protein
MERRDVGVDEAGLGAGCGGRATLSSHLRFPRYRVGCHCPGAWTLWSCGAERPVLTDYSNAHLAAVTIRSAARPRRPDADMTDHEGRMEWRGHETWYRVVGELDPGALVLSS